MKKEISTRVIHKGKEVLHLAVSVHGKLSDSFEVTLDASQFNDYKNLSDKVIEDTSNEVILKYIEKHNALPSTSRYEYELSKETNKKNA